MVLATCRPASGAPGPRALAPGWTGTPRPAAWLFWETDPVLFWDPRPICSRAHGLYSAEGVGTFVPRRAIVRRAWPGATRFSPEQVPRSCQPLFGARWSLCEARQGYTMTSGLLFTADSTAERLADKP